MLLIAFSRRYYFKRSVRSVYCISRKTKYGNERRWSNNDFNYGGSKRLCLDGLYQRIASTVIPIYSAFVRDLFISTKPPALLLWFVSLNSTLVYNDDATLLSSATGVIDNMHVAYLQLKLTAEHNYDCLSCKSIAFNNEWPYPEAKGSESYQFNSWYRSILTDHFNKKPIGWTTKLSTLLSFFAGR